jgi:hypothetical protein
VKNKSYILLIGIIGVIFALIFDNWTNTAKNDITDNIKNHFFVDENFYSQKLTIAPNENDFVQTFYFDTN